MSPPELAEIMRRAKTNAEAVPIADMVKLIDDMHMQQHHMLVNVAYLQERVERAERNAAMTLRLACCVIGGFIGHAIFPLLLKMLNIS